MFPLNLRLDLDDADGERLCRSLLHEPSDLDPLTTLVAWLHGLKMDLLRLDLAKAGQIVPVITKEHNLLWSVTTPEDLDTLQQHDAFRLAPEELLPTLPVGKPANV